MQQLTSDAERTIANLSDRYRVSQDVVRTLLFAVSNGGGSMAQFSHPELGGSGQWMRGGMTMVGDMFNSGLQGIVSGICSELSNLLASTQVFLPLPRMTSGQQQQQNNGFGNFGGYSGNWWPADLGSPSSSGGQNGSSYAYFPQARRLAVQNNGQISIYDTLDHQIGGVQQQQGGPSGSQSFSSQFGTFTVESLPLVSGNGSSDSRNNGNNWGNNPAPQSDNPLPQQPSYVQQPAQSYGGGSSSDAQGDVIATLERLGALRDKGILSDQEFQAKKAELLGRL